MIIQVTYERVYNLGNYESERLSATVTVEDTTEAAYDEARAAVADEHARTVAARQQVAQQPNGGATYDPPASDKQRAYIATLIDKLGWSSEQMTEYLGTALTEMTKSQASGLIDRLQQEFKQEQIATQWAPRVVGKQNPPPDDALDLF